MAESAWLEDVQNSQASLASSNFDDPSFDALTEQYRDANPYAGFKNKHDYDAAILQKSMDQQFNSAEAQKNRDWQADQNARKYQIAMEDLKAAGVNPYYLFSQGGTATSASGGSAATSSGSSIPSGSKAGSTALAAGLAIAKLIATIAAA